MEILNMIVYLLIALLTMAIPICVIVGVVLLVKTSNEKDPIKKKKVKKWGIYCCVLPVVLLFVVLSIWGLINIGTHTITGPTN